MTFTCDPPTSTARIVPCDLRFLAAFFMRCIFSSRPRRSPLPSVRSRQPRRLGHPQPPRRPRIGAHCVQPRRESPTAETLTNVGCRQNRRACPLKHDRRSPLRSDLQGSPTQRSRWSEGRGPRGMRASKARAGPRVGKACHRRWSAYGKSRVEAQDALFQLSVARLSRIGFGS